MLWSLIFHSAKLLNFVPALHGIMFSSSNFHKKCNELRLALSGVLSLRGLQLTKGFTANVCPRGTVMFLLLLYNTQSLSTPVLYTR